MFLGFANFYKRFIRNFGRIAALLISMFQTRNDETLSNQGTKDKRNETALAGVNSGGVSSGVSENIKNLSTAINLAKKSKLIKLKKAGLPNIKADSRTDFLTPEAKKAFIHLQKAFIKAPILKHFDPEHYI